MWLGGGGVGGVPLKPKPSCAISRCLVDSLLVGGCSCSSCCDRGKTKPTLKSFDLSLEFDNIIFDMMFLIDSLKDMNILSA